MQPRVQFMQITLMKPLPSLSQVLPTRAIPSPSYHDQYGILLLPALALDRMIALWPFSMSLHDRHWMLICHGIP
jgi:hypothetical protein